MKFMLAGVLPALVVALSACGTSEELKVTGTHYAFTAPGSFDQVQNPANAFGGPQYRAAGIVLDDHEGNSIYVSVRENQRLPKGTARTSDQVYDALWRMIGQEAQNSRQVLGRPTIVTVAGLDGLRLEGIPGRDTGAETRNSINYALHNVDRVFVVTCQWRYDPQPARDACRKTLGTFEVR